MSDLFASGSSCGPSNPLESLGKHSGNISAAQNERFVQARSNGNASFRTSNQGLSRQANNEFAAFSSPDRPQTATPEFYQHNHLMGRAPIHHQHQSQAPTSQSDWAADFAKMAVSTRLPGVMSNRSMQQSPLDASELNQAPSRMNQHLYTPSMNPGLRLHYASSPAFESQTQQHQHLYQPQNQMEASFKDAFDQVEHQVMQEEQQTNETIAPGTLDDSDLSDLASTIIGNIKNNTTSLKPATSEKFQQSNFMALMSELSTRDVQLQNDKFVARGQDQQVEFESLPRIGQLHQQAVNSHEEPGSTVKQESSSQQPHLEDPFAYFERMGKKLDDMTASPFEVAQALAPPGVVTSSHWEESIDQ